MIAIGVIDTKGYISAVEALDVCLKTADVELVVCEKITGGIVSLTITGEVAAVTSAVQAGVAAAQRLDGYLNHTVIARIDEQTGKFYERPQPPEPPEPDPDPLDGSPSGYDASDELVDVPEPEADAPEPEIDVPEVEADVAEPEPEAVAPEQEATEVAEPEIAEPEPTAQEIAEPEHAEPEADTSEPEADTSEQDRHEQGRLVVKPIIPSKSTLVKKKHI